MIFYNCMRVYVGIGYIHNVIIIYRKNGNPIKPVQKLTIFNFISNIQNHDLCINVPTLYDAKI